MVFFLLKIYRLLVHIKTAIPRRFEEVPTIYALEQKEDRKIIYTSINPSFSINKWMARGSRGSKLHGHVSLFYGDFVLFKVDLVSVKAMRTKTRLNKRM